MAYRKPGVTVTQEFAAAAPALAAFNLPCVTVGPSFQLLDEEDLGLYEATETLFPYTSLLGGAVVDLAELDLAEPYPAIFKPITASLTGTVVEVLAEQNTGAVDGTAFTDPTATQFADVVAGDYVHVIEELGLTIVPAQTNGISKMGAGLTNRLESFGANEFATVKVGDTVAVTGLAPSIAGTFLVTAKVGDNIVLLDGAINDGSADSVAVNYSITGNRGTVNAGNYKVKTKTDANTLVLESSMTDPVEAPLTYTIQRKVGTAVLSRVATISENGFVASEDGLTLPAVLTVGGLEVVSGELIASYRALRSDLASEIRTYVDVASLNAVFGVGQLTPPNELAFGLTIMLQNTVTPINGLALDANGVDNEVLAYTAALDVLKRYDMYAIGVLSQSPVVHTMYKNHVEQMSLPNRKLERVVIFNSALPTLMVLQDEMTTVTTIPGSRSVVGMQVNGSGGSGFPKKLITTGGKFAGVKAGDSLVVVAGTVVTPGTYIVESVPDTNTLNTLASGLAWISGAAVTDIQFYVYRLDGLAADGLSFYDRNATFLSLNVASGHKLSIMNTAFASRYTIATVVSEKEVTLLPAVLGVTSLVTGVQYQVDRDLSRVEQSDAVKGYSESFSSRRCVHLWPDVLEVPIGQQIYAVPGYFGVCSINALTTGLPTQQGFTNLAVSGFLGLNHSSRYFTEEQLDNIADGGTMLLAQDGPQQPLYIRHQLTTDRSSIKFQEYSVTKNVDYIAKFWRITYGKFIGQYNIIDTTLDALKLTANSGLKFLKDSKVPKFGGVIRSGELKSVTESTTAIDTVEIVISHNIPIPLNNIDITIQV